MRARHLESLAAIVLALIAACATNDRKFMIRSRNPADFANPPALAKDYPEEFDYVRSRRRQLDGARPDVEQPEKKRDASGAYLPPPPDRLIGLAYSGGGIRSATFALGFTQGLRNVDMFDQFDYVSAVSGGGYLAGWEQAHLGAVVPFERDEYEYDVHAHRPDELLDDEGDSVEHLRTHSGFLNQGGWWEGPRMVLAYLWRWPFHVILDDVVHYRSSWNFHHVIDIYRARIEGTYFRGVPRHRREARSIPDVRLVDVNQPGHEGATPYMILNGNLTNHGRSRLGIAYPDGTTRRNAWSFEFTRDYTGSDATGYVQSAGFGVPVKRVAHREGVPVSATVELADGVTSPFRLSQAVAASGAAFDSLGFFGGIDVPVVTEAGQLIAGGIFNLNLGIDVPNFARDLDHWGTPFDYARMVTYQRVPRFVDPGARWLQISDGGHYENLGVLALLRRGVQCIVVADATADPGGTYDDLQTLRERARNDLALEVTSVPERVTEPVSRIVVTDAKGVERAVLLYVKASTDRSFRHMCDEPAGDAELRFAAIRGDLVAAIGALLDQLERALPGPAAARVAAARPGLLAAARDAIDEGEYAKGREKVASSVQAVAAGQKVLGKGVTELETAQKQLLALETAPAPPEAESAETPPPETPEVTALREQIEALRTQLDADQRAVRAAEEEVAKAKGVPLIVERFDRAVDGTDHTGGFRRRIDELLAQVPADATEWGHRFELVLNRARLRLDGVVRRDRDREREIAARSDRIDRIDRIQAFERNARTFPNDSTLTQWYTWERFEAYRLLGYQMAATYLRPLSPGPDGGLGWCTLPPPPSCDDGAAAAPR